MELKKALNIVRNPYGFGVDEKREARVVVANEVEKLQKENKKLKSNTKSEPSLIVNPEKGTNEC